jgi:hypothetical protein
LGSGENHDGAEERKLGYLFKLKQSGKVKKLIGQIFGKEEWVEAGQGWQGREDVLRLSGWTSSGGWWCCGGR